MKLSQNVIFQRKMYYTARDEYFYVRTILLQNVLREVENIRLIIMKNHFVPGQHLFFCTGKMLDILSF